MDRGFDRRLPVGAVGRCHSQSLHVRPMPAATNLHFKIIESPAVGKVESLLVHESVESARGGKRVSHPILIAVVAVDCIELRQSIVRADVRPIVVREEGV